MFGHDDQNDNNVPTVNPTDTGAADAALPFDPAAVGLGNDQPQADTTAPAVSHDEPADAPAPATPVSDDHLLEPATADTGLLSIKQQALQQLSPLVDHLDQTPEEKFRTTMMMIQASDDQSLIQAAYDSAQAITDDKVRAQALLDIINEINYFTQQHQD